MNLEIDPMIADDELTVEQYLERQFAEIVKVWTKLGKFNSY